MILFMCLNYLRLMILMVIWLDLLILLATTMKEEVMRGFIMLLIIISRKGLLLIYIGWLIFIVIHSYTKCLCIERKLDFVVITFVLCFFSLPGFNFLIIMIGLREPWDPGIIYGTIPKEEGHAKIQVPSWASPILIIK
jgi:hypothetical protein